MVGDNGADGNDLGFDIVSSGMGCSGNPWARVGRFAIIQVNTFSGGIAWEYPPATLLSEIEPKIFTKKN